MNVIFLCQKIIHKNNSIMIKKITFLVLVLVYIGINTNAQDSDWNQLGNSIFGSNPEDCLGTYVDISSDGSILAIGIPQSDSNGSNSGCVKVYQNISGVWTQLGNDLIGIAHNDLFGSRLSLSNDGLTIAIGAHLNDEIVNACGVVQVFHYTNGSWVQKGNNIYGQASADMTGRGVSLSADGNVLAVGTVGNDDAGYNVGSVKIFQYVTEEWVQIGNSIYGEAERDYCGRPVCLSADGTTVAIGAPDNDGNGVRAGHVRVFKNISGTWTQIGDDIDGDVGGDVFGYALDLSADGSTLVASAYMNNYNGQTAGQVKIFKNISGIWTQIGDDIYGFESHQLFGWAVNISDDGSTIAVGARATDEHGTNTGHVRIFENIAGSWVQIGSPIIGDAERDEFGYCVALNSDGTKVAIGAPYNDNNGYNTGQVKVFEKVCICTTPPTPNLTELPNITDQSIISTLPEYTATDGCGNTIMATHDAVLPITLQDTTLVTWTYEDGQGNITTQTQKVIIKDITAPVPDKTVLEDLTSECEINSLTAPSATDNCAGTINGTYDIELPITEQGVTVITWTYDDGNGNITTQTQNVILNDQTAPTPDQTSLDEITAECEVAELTPPTATDDCVGTITGTHNIELPITTKGTTLITWIFDDGNGNSSTQTQLVTIEDNNAPVPYNSSLNVLYAECEITELESPTATDDCEGLITATHNASLPITTQGITTITWTYDDGNGNRLSQNQTIIIEDETEPTITCTDNQTVEISQQNNHYIVEGAEFDPISFEDNCQVSSVTNDFNNLSTLENAELPLGTTIVTWTISDIAGNTASSQTAISVETLIGINNLTHNVFSVYPNPTKGILHFNSKGQEVHKVIITDIAGKTVYEEHTNTRNSINISHLNNGVYIISLQSYGKIFCEKIIKD
jgi:hypothetical protein